MFFPRGGSRARKVHSVCTLEMGAGDRVKSKELPHTGGDLDTIVWVQVVNHRLDEVRGGGVTAHVPRPNLKIQHREGEKQKGRNVDVNPGKRTQDGTGNMVTAKQLPPAPEPLSETPPSPAANWKNRH